jgi:type III secretion protein C
MNRKRLPPRWQLACLAPLLAASVAQAGPLPNGTRAVSITAREQPIAAFLQDLSAEVEVPVEVSPKVTGTVNGTFSGSAEKVLHDVARVYNLVGYFDGAVMHVVPASELATRTFAVPRTVAERALRDSYELGLPDARDSVRTTADGDLIAIGTPRFIEQIQDLVRAAQTAQLAASAPPTPGMLDFQVFYLRYAWAQDTTMTLANRQVVVPGVASILRSLVGAHTAGTAIRDVALRPSQPKLKGHGLASQGASPAPDATKARNGVDTLVAALNNVAQAGAPPADDGEVAPMAFDPRQVTIEAEPRLNAVIVRDAPDRLPRYAQLIAALDVEPQTLEIEATIIDISTDRLQELGVDWNWSNARQNLGFSGTVPTTGPGAVASAVIGSLGQFAAHIRALQSEGAARVVSSPQVVTLSNVEAVFDDTSTFYVRVAGSYDVDLFDVTVGTSLRVTPHVFRDRDDTRIKLMVQVEDGSLTGQTVDQIPVVTRSTIDTQALINEGESLLIGGMVRESTSSNVDKVPGLGDVPVVGNLFKSRTRDNGRVERMVLITPRLAMARPGATGAGLSGGATAPAKQASVVLDLDTLQTSPAGAATAPMPARVADEFIVPAPQRPEPSPSSPPSPPTTRN